MAHSQSLHCPWWSTVKLCAANDGSQSISLLYVMAMMAHCQSLCCFWWLTVIFCTGNDGLQWISALSVSARQESLKLQQANQKSKCFWIIAFNGKIECKKISWLRILHIFNLAATFIYDLNIITWPPSKGTSLIPLSSRVYKNEQQTHWIRE